MKTATVAAAQMECSADRQANLEKAKAMVREAAAAGAQIVVLQELFESVYFCKDQDATYFGWASEIGASDGVSAMRALARECAVVLPVSFFERDGHAHFNSLAMIDADGALLGVYRKSHIPDGPGYQEKYYFSPGDTGFKVWQTRYGRVGAAVCWDQWFPEAARAMALQGADLLVYPTAIGSEPPPAPQIDSRRHWQRVMQGHAAANMTPVVAANRVGKETGQTAEITFYGSSFVADETGAIVAEAGTADEALVLHTFDFDAIAERRLGWGLFRDRRPDLYGPLTRFGLED